jgi:Mn-dependent DtxR family transcriptional regulator
MGTLQRQIITTLAASNGALCVQMLSERLSVEARSIWRSVMRLAEAGEVRVTRRRATYAADRGALVELVGEPHAPLAAHGTVEAGQARPEASP